MDEKLSTEALLEHYGKMSAEEQKEKFHEIYSSLIGYRKNNFFLLFIFMKLTKEEILAVASDKVTRSIEGGIVRLRIIFINIKKTIDKIPRESIKIFLETFQTNEMGDLRNFFSNVGTAILDMHAIERNNEGSLKEMNRKIDMSFEVLSESKRWIENKVDEFSIINILENKKNAFYRTAEKHRVRGEWFLGSSILVVAMLILWGLILLHDPLSFDKDIKDYAMIGHIVGKSIISATLFLALASFLRIYFANKHNETIYQQKSDILESYQLIYNTTDEKGIVLRKLIESIFEQQPTGFSKFQGGSSSSSISSDLGNILSILLRRLK